MMLLAALLAATLSPSIVTLAGDGRPGIVDGPAHSARFEGPQGLAYDARGNLYVADAAAQRIRRIDAHGVVTTVAGSGSTTLFGSAVAGGYRDGEAARAQFEMPEGVAAARDGTIYVADTGNHCVRAIHNGVVSTIAGAPSRAGNADGAVAAASFQRPRSIAVDPISGALFVADVGNGVRRIAGGRVETIGEPAFATAWAVSIYRNGASDELLVATPQYIWAYDLIGNTLLWGVATERRATYAPLSYVPGPSLLGPPSDVVAIGEKQLVYTDDLLSTVHYVDGMTSRILGAQPLLNASGRGGGFADGALDAALYDQPMGIAVAPDGRIAIADTANRRIRLLSLPRNGAH